MESITHLAPASATWQSPHAFQRAFDLTADGTALGSLQFVSAFGSLAEGRTADGAWTFKRGGFLRPRVTIRAEGVAEDAGVFEARWGGDGELRLANGFRAHWVHTNFWRTRWTFQLPDGRPLLHFAPDQHFLKAGAIVEFERAVPTDVPIGLLVLLGWYLMVLMAEETMGAGAAVMAAG